MLGILLLSGMTKIEIGEVSRALFTPNIAMLCRCCVLRSRCVTLAEHGAAAFGRMFIGVDGVKAAIMCAANMLSNTASRLRFDPLVGAVEGRSSIHIAVVSPSEGLVVVVPPSVRNDRCASDSVAGKSVSVVNACLSRVMKSASDGLLTATVHPMEKSSRSSHLVTNNSWMLLLSVLQ